MGYPKTFMINIATGLWKKTQWIFLVDISSSTHSILARLMSYSLPWGNQHPSLGAHPFEWFPERWSLDVVKCESNEQFNSSDSRRGKLCQWMWRRGLLYTNFLSNRETTFWICAVRLVKTIERFYFRRKTNFHEHPGQSFSREYGHGNRSG